MSKKVLMIAGPNGSGKTTMALTLIPNFTQFYEFINADEIARGLSPIHPEKMALSASKLMIKRLKELIDTDKSFAFETTAAGTNYVRHLENAKKNGFETSLIYLWLSSPDQAVKRVKERVEQGGHFIPEQTIQRRYFLGIKNIYHDYLPIIDNAILIDNSNHDKITVIARKNKSAFEINDDMRWNKIKQVVHG